MTPQYFAFIDGSQQGPFELDKLPAAGVRPSTYIWCKGMDDWHRADEVAEVREMFRRHLNNRSEPQVAAPEIQTPQPEPRKNFFGGEKEQKEQKPETMRFGRIPPVEEQEPDINRPPQVSMTLAVMSLILCFIPTGIAAVIFAFKAQKAWEQSLKDVTAEERENLRKACHEYERQAKMWLGLTVAFGIIFWTLIFSVRPIG